MGPSDASLFDGDAMADGYDSARPALHTPIMDRVATALGWPAGSAGRAERAIRTIVDVGCGAGASTAAVRPWSDRVAGVDPAVAMVERAARRHRDAKFVVASGLALPFRSATVDAIVAAGALNFMDLAAFRAEAARALSSTGVVIAYDFSTGCRATVNPDLAIAYAAFARRWPRPIANRHPVDPAVLAAAGFALRAHDTFVHTLTMSAKQYVDYLMTETNVAGALASGHVREDVDRWCRARFTPVLGDPQPVEFDCWYAIVDPAGSGDHVGEQ